MTDHGEPYEGERKKGSMTAKAKGGGLDPVGKEDADVNNDGKVNKSDKYLLKRRKAIGNAIRTQAEAYLADGTISTEPRGKKEDEVSEKKKVDNYKSGAVTMSPDPQKEEEKKTKSMQYAHHLLKGSTLSEAQKRMIEMYDEKKKKEELEKKDKVSSMMTKSSVKKEDEKEEEKPDLRSKYAMINLIKNKLRAAGQRDPMVMAVDACEERTPAQGDKSFDIMRPGGKNSPYDKDGKPKKKKPTGTNELVFTLAIAAANAATNAGDILAIGANAMNLNSGTIKDAGTNTASTITSVASIGTAAGTVTVVA